LFEEKIKEEEASIRKDIKVLYKLHDKFTDSQHVLRGNLRMIKNTVDEILSEMNKVNYKDTSREFIEVLENHLTYIEEIKGDVIDRVKSGDAEEITRAIAEVGFNQFSNLIKKTKVEFTEISDLAIETSKLKFFTKLLRKVSYISNLAIMLRTMRGEIAPRDNIYFTTKNTGRFLCAYNITTGNFFKACKTNKASSIIQLPDATYITRGYEKSKESVNTI
jgi:hypothetical protein